MAYKQVLFHSEAREKVLRGAAKLADAIRVTLGPKSKSVLIQKKWGAPLVCNDGVTIAKEFSLKDPEENLGAQMLRQASERTGEAVGDGTSTAAVLAHALGWGCSSNASTLTRPVPPTSRPMTLVQKPRCLGCSRSLNCHFQH